MKRIIIAALITFIVPSAYANWKNGNDLYESCELYQALKQRQLSTLEQVISGECMTYTMGWLDGNETSLMPLICVPENVKFGSLVDMLIKFLEENPAERHYPANSIMFNAFKEFECPDPFIE